MQTLSLSLGIKKRNGNWIEYQKVQTIIQKRKETGTYLFSMMRKSFEFWPAWSNSGPHRSDPGSASPDLEPRGWVLAPPWIMPGHRVIGLGCAAWTASCHREPYRDHRMWTTPSCHHSRSKTFAGAGTVVWPTSSRGTVHAPSRRH
jgi:hypothetical protein